MVNYQCEFTIKSFSDFLSQKLHYLVLSFNYTYFMLIFSYKKIIEPFCNFIAIYLFVEYKINDDRAEENNTSENNSCYQTRKQWKQMN